MISQQFSIIDNMSPRSAEVSSVAFIFAVTSEELYFDGDWKVLMSTSTVSGA